VDTRQDVRTHLQLAEIGLGPLLANIVQRWSEVLICRPGSKPGNSKGQGKQPEE
jgi:hypothetical protein